MPSSTPSSKFRDNRNSMAFENHPIQFSSDFMLLQSSGGSSHFNSGFLSNLPSSPNFHSLQEFALQPSSAVTLSNNSTSDEAEDRHMEAVDERKRRRMISNRESARRSRMRKQRQIDELWSQVMKLRTENQELHNKLKQASECHDRVLEENAQLKQESAGLREVISDLQLDDTYSVLKGLEEISCNTAHLKAEGPNQLQAGICNCKLEI